MSIRVTRGTARERGESYRQVHQMNDPHRRSNRKRDPKEDTMTTNNLIKSIFGAALMLGVSASSMFIADEAEAKRGGRETYVQQYDVDRPLHGYEGYAARGYYCSYKRLPKRTCNWNGERETCKVVGWTLEQSCQ